MAQSSGGLCCLSDRLTSYASTIIDAPPDEVWKAIIDIDNYPSTVSMVKAVERIDGSEKGYEVTVGTRWKETRTYRGKTIVQTKTVSAIGSREKGEGGSAVKSEEWPKSFSLAIAFDAPYDNVCNTSTLTVEPYRHQFGGDEGDAELPSKENLQRTILGGTFAVISSRLKHRFAFSLRSRCKSAPRAFQIEIDELGAAAVKNATGSAMSSRK
mmetsp:Transcript_3365/g.5879  ORF Transcript_3365/g.5879 Transcript_3365/m.5879 type:complete len:212 (-) Transcript_3365:963-1598(-)|eukprot:CAMPEP_0197440304 /NCGR_PEP_ID=MMETSP1175-20131217/6838_1 /TAXON_ID=1003142 /ORGANISM="Triceratium dubium, Strain CCMP147" /LENGTH=211 /DNA_ID=CAMNT_0042970375 /DNA_START=135 /DNA_END=770 /DNA_ORIENTATION=-